MMDVSNFILTHKTLAPLLIFLSVVLAGANIPISIDVVLVLTAFIAATILPEKATLLFFTYTIAAIVSASLSYWIGRGFGRKVLRIPLFTKLVPEKKLDKMADFYKKYGFWAFLFGRFIPFGVRNCLFLSSGISKIPYQKFLLYDVIACSLWSSTFFFVFFHLSQNYEMLLAKFRLINICIFVAFSVTLIALICYKVSKRRTQTTK